jgi:hypothetical protein
MLVAQVWLIYVLVGKGNGWPEPALVGIIRDVPSQTTKHMRRGAFLSI